MADLVEPAGRLLFVGHGAERSGPPTFLLHLQRWLASTHPEVAFETVLARGGALQPAFRELGTVQVLEDGWTAPRIVQAGLGRLGWSSAADVLGGLRRRSRLRRLQRPDLLYLNTASSGGIAAVRGLPADVPLLSHVHELDVGLRYGLDDADRAYLLRRTDRFVAASGAVADNLVGGHGVPVDRVVVHHEMIDTADGPDPRRVELVRERLGLGPDAQVVGASGMTDWRKAPDLFVRLAWEVARRPGGEHVHFLWVGGADHGPEWWPLEHDLRRLGLLDRVHFVGTSPHPLDELSLCDLFVLPSREDAFPLACLEAATLGLPIVCFDNGGMPEMVEASAGGVVVAYPDLASMADVVVDLLTDDERRVEMGRAAEAEVRARHDVRVAAPSLLADVRALW